MYNPTIILNAEQLRGIVKFIIWQYDVNVRDISKDVSLSVEVGKIELDDDVQYVVRFEWVAESILIHADTETGHQEYDHQLGEDKFYIRPDESFSKLEQYVTDVLGGINK